MNALPWDQRGNDEGWKRVPSAFIEGLPRRADLTTRQRLLVDSSALADLALRTSIASLLSATMVPTVAGALRRSQSRAEIV